MILKGGIFLHVLFICAAIADYSCASQTPELQILQGEQVGGSFCPGSTARLKCAFPENMEALAWYVNGSDRPTEVRFLSEDYQGHSVDNSRESGYTLVNIFKEEPYRASYICAVFHISDSIQGNSVEVIFKGTLFLFVSTCFKIVLPNWLYVCPFRYTTWRHHSHLHIQWQWLPHSGSELHKRLQEGDGGRG